MLDIFKSNPAFGVVPLTIAINNLKFVPGRLRTLGLFNTSSVATTSIAIENKNGVLKLIAPTPRGGPGTVIEKPKRGLRTLAIPHFEINDAVMAEEVQGVRSFGTENGVEMLTDKIVERDVIHVQSMEATTEYSRIGAVKGIITYADGATTDLFAEFGVAQEAEIAFNLANIADGNLRKKCAGIYRQMAGILEGVPFTGIHALCGDNFFDDFIMNEEVRASYLQQQEASELRTGYVNNGQTGAFGTFTFGGIVWENYRGYVGNTSFIHADKVHLFPTGAPGLFQTVHGPADYIETVNTLGRRFYQKQYPMPNDKGINLDVQMNELNFCTRPKALLKGKRGA